MANRPVKRKGNIRADKADNSVSVSLNPSIYPLDVIYSAAYVFLDRAYVFIDGNPSKEVVVELKPKAGKTDLETLGREFNNELLNYAVYKKQVEKNSQVRQVIMQRALLTNDLNVPKPGGASFIDDPEGIAIPWEEKYAKKPKSK